jgi:hypothetical protein
MAYTTIDKPTDYFNTILYTGNGGSQNITGVGFSPDWVWLKGRNNANNHNLNDKVRGVNKQLYADLNNAETTATTHLTAFDSDGFTLGNDGAVNGSSDTYVSWNWLASGSTASNTDGTITSTVSANTTVGFSIVSWSGNGTSGATVGHGISTPDVIIAKSRSGAHNWYVYHKSNGVGYGKLNLTDAFNSATDVFTVAPTSSVFTISADTSINNSGDNFIAYCFAEKKGYSKFGSYTGNGNADGTFAYTGFKPAWLMIKDFSASGDDWLLFDNKRDTFNVANKQLASNGSGAEITGQTYNYIDFLSNGFKIRGSDARNNGSGNSYIYMCFAEAPFVTSTGIPTTAR